MTSLTLSSAAVDDLRVDALVVGVHGPASTGAASGRRRGGSPAAVSVAGAAALDRVVAGGLVAALTSLSADTAVGTVTKLPGAGGGVVAAVGLGPAPAGRDGVDLETLRRAAGAAARALAGVRRVGMLLPASSPDEVGAVAEGSLFGAYAFLRFRHTTAAAHKAPVDAFTLVTDLAKDRAARAAAARAQAIATSVVLVRDLVNTPASHLHPKELADAAVEAAAGLPVTVEVLDERALKRGGYGGTLAVGAGSVNPPRLVRIAYAPRRATQHLALVGKGITFDTGGISLKPAAGMDWMKSDMGGAAAVIGAILAVARLGLPVAVTAYAPMAENMPSGTAQRPGDVITIYGGTTVEVLNTDAEGRLVLADGLVRAGEDKPDCIVDVATLTGAQLVALGSRTSAIMANDDDFRARVHAAAERAGEPMWPMPLPEELRKGMDSEVADIANMGEKYGGMLTAGRFLKEFVPDDVSWAHLDIAGPSWNEGPAYGYTPKGATGAAVRTLVALAEDLAGGR